MVGCDVIVSIFRLLALRPLAVYFGGIPQELPSFTLPEFSFSHMVQLMARLHHCHAGRYQIIVIGGGR